MDERGGGGAEEVQLVVEGGGKGWRVLIPRIRDGSSRNSGLTLMPEAWWESDSRQAQAQAVVGQWPSQSLQAGSWSGRSEAFQRLWPRQRAREGTVHFCTVLGGGDTAKVASPCLQEG